jgi:hypothetical protein
MVKEFPWTIMRTLTNYTVRPPLPMEASTCHSTSYAKTAEFKNAACVTLHIISYDPDMRNDKTCAHS